MRVRDEYKTGALDDDHPILADAVASNGLADDAYGDYQIQITDDRTIAVQKRLRYDLADLEWLAKLSTYHGTLCTYISAMMVPIAYCSKLPHETPITSTSFGALSVAAILFNASAALLSYMTIRKARMVPVEIPLRRTYQTPEPSFIPYYIHYFRGRCRNQFVVTFLLGTFCVVFQIVFYFRLRRHAQLSDLREQIAYYTALLETTAARGHKTTEITSLTWGPNPLTSVSTNIPAIVRTAIM
ncbi:hypothetical protein CYLTODRAFT_440644 [Cylindrobasidium torrendii FP15055 ss-10]|uniref:Uncharacterized protein n=1 Tax=Cylindrobasidium torrendii FP15055 ss-10 TaxID=1314674 RepID=A0A0D7BQ88_9AGAR|nr:hypothetical protein CYLTODRAFT_440644 [Cylindrobasidium torrendii FP15055 ss-10]